MQLTTKLLGWLHRVFDKDPRPFVALRIDYAGGLAWTVSQDTLTLTVTGGAGASVAYDLTAYSLESLVAAIAGRTGFSVDFLDPERAKLSAVVLLDGAGDLSQPNGGALFGYTSLLWAFLEAYARELGALHDAVAQVPAQMSTTTAEGPWLDELGSYYDVPREVGETDPLYGPRIIAQVLRPVSNNVAIENAIQEFTGQPCTVVDVVVYSGGQLYNGTVNFDGTINYDALSPPHYGLFDVTIGYDLISGGDISTFTDTVQAIVERLRSAGTHLRSLALAGATTPISESMPAPGESMSSFTAVAALADTLVAPAEVVSALTTGVTPTVETLPAPVETVLGAILQQLTTEAGEPILTTGGDPIYAQVGTIFV
jgi:hypothetical protein